MFWRRPEIWPEFGRVATTLIWAILAAQVCLWLRTPLPWMIGPMLAVSAASMMGAPMRSSRHLRNFGQCVIGCALGLYFTPQVGALVASLSWAIALGIVWALLLGWCFGWVLYQVHKDRLPGVTRATTYFAGAIGGASEMTLLAERAQARTDLVASAHTLRVMLITVLIPFAFQFSGLHGLDLSPPTTRQTDPMGLAMLGLLTGVGAWCMARLGRANPWFMGALLVAMVLSLAGITLSAIPTPLSNLAQLFIAISLGVRFTPAFIQLAPRWLFSVAVGTLVLIGVSLVLAWALSRATNLPLATLILSTAPGGIAEMAITAKVLQLGVPVVTAFQVCRLVAVLLLTEPLYRWRAHPPAQDGV